jgi:hypothetical protein
MCKRRIGFGGAGVVSFIRIRDNPLTGYPVNTVGIASTLYDVDKKL